MIEDGGEYGVESREERESVRSSWSTELVLGKKIRAFLAGKRTRTPISINWVKTTQSFTTTTAFSHKIPPNRTSSKINSALNQLQCEINRKAKRRQQSS